MWNCSQKINAKKVNHILIPYKAECQICLDIKNAIPRSHTLHSAYSYVTTYLYVCEHGCTTNTKEKVTRTRQYWTDMNAGQRNHKQTLPMYVRNERWDCVYTFHCLLFRSGRKIQNRSQCELPGSTAKASTLHFTKKQSKERVAMRNNQQSIRIDSVIKNKPNNNKSSHRWCLPNWKLKRELI